MILDFFNNNFIMNPIHNIPSMLNTYNGVITIGTSNIDSNHILNVKGDVLINGDITTTQPINNNTLYANAIHQHSPEDLNTTDALIFDNSGKLGIHVNPPNFPLDVNGSINASDFNINGKTIAQKVEEIAPKGVNVDVFDITYDITTSVFTYRYNYSINKNDQNKNNNKTYDSTDDYNIYRIPEVRKLIYNQFHTINGSEIEVAENNVENNLISKSVVSGTYKYNFEVDPTATKTFWLIFNSKHKQYIESFGIDGAISDSSPKILNYLAPRVFNMTSSTTNVSNTGYTFDIKNLNYTISGSVITLESSEEIHPLVAIRFSSYT